MNENRLLILASNEMLVGILAMLLLGSVVVAALCVLMEKYAGETK